MARIDNCVKTIRQAGAGLVETMVGILVGLLIILVIYSLVSASEGYRRTTTGASDAQITGLLSQFILGRDAGNGGNGLTLSAPDLVKCTKTEAGAADLTSKPIPVLVTDGGGAGISDTFIAMNSGAPHVLWPVEFTADSLPGTDFVVQTPNGFAVEQTPPTPSTSGPTAAAPYWVIATANDGTGKCKMFRITNATTPDAQGRVTLTHMEASTITYTAAAPAKLVILGPQGLATRVQYDSWNSTLGEPCGTTPEVLRPCQLTSLDLMTAGAARNPVSANVVLLKVQYGIDTTASPDNVIDCWTAADNLNTCGDGRNYTPAGVQAFNVDDLNRIMAVRIGVVIRSDEPDLKDDTLTAAGVGAIPARPDLYLFNCAANDATCQSRILLPKGNAGSKKLIQDYWRYRTYETVVPLRNAIYSGTIP